MTKFNYMLKRKIKPSNRHGPGLLLAHPEDSNRRVGIKINITALEIHLLWTWPSTQNAT